MRYELIMWLNHILKMIPGNIGCKIRNRLLPYKQGKNVKIWDSVHIDSPSKVTLGDHVSINRGCVLNAGGNIYIGNDVLIGPNVIIYSQNHKFREKSIPKRLQGYSQKEVRIGDNVWIAANCIILPGVTIGDNSVIAAGTIVKKSVPKDCILYNDKLVAIWEDDAK